MSDDFPRDDSVIEGAGDAGGDNHGVSETTVVERPKGPWRHVRRYCLSVAFIYFGVCAGLFFIQRHILYPRDADPVPLPTTSDFAGLEEVTLEASDGVRVKAWYWAGEHPTTVVVFHGNGGHRGLRRYWMKDIRDLGYGVMIFDYRGYGGSDGSPTEEGLYSDAEAAIAWLDARGSRDLVYFGESLGAGVAVEMARRRQPKALVLQSAFTSAVAIAEGIYWFLPVGLLMQDRYDNLAKIHAIECPVLCIHGARDRIIPMEFGRTLFDAASEPKEWYEIEKAGHNDLTIIGGRGYLRRVDEFLKRHE